MTPGVTLPPIGACVCVPLGVTMLWAMVQFVEHKRTVYYSVQCDLGVIDHATRRCLNFRKCNGAVMGGGGTRDVPSGPGCMDRAVQPGHQTLTYSLNLWR